MLQIDALTRRFGELTAVDEVSFDVGEGHLVGFVGGNGAGKTTTMRMIMGVLAIHAGTVRWQGHPLTAADRRTFGYMPEERGLYPKQPILDQLVYLARLKGRDTPGARREAMAALERFGLGERATDRVEKLSLGNQQRVQIIAALLAQPKALILDEPFSGLDPDAVDAMVDLLREHTRCGVPVLFSSHQLDLVERLCDHIVVLRRGRVVARGTVAELRSAGARAHRLVLDADAAWVRQHPGVVVLESDGPSCVLDALTSDAAHGLLAEALRRGAVREFSPIIPTLSEIYREVTA